MISFCICELDIAAVLGTAIITDVHVHQCLRIPNEELKNNSNVCVFLLACTPSRATL